MTNPNASRYRTTTSITIRSAILALGLALCPATTHAETSLFISDGDTIHRYDFQSTTLGNFTSLMGVTGLAVGPDGYLYAAQTIPMPEVYRYDIGTGAQIDPGPFVPYYGQPPTPDPRDVINPQGMRVGSDGRLFIADVTNSNVHVYDHTGTSLGSLEDPSLVQPTDVALDVAGNVYVTSGSANILRSAAGSSPFSEFVPTLSGGLTNPVALTFGPGGQLYVLDISTSNVLRYNADGTFDAAVIQLGSEPFIPSNLAFGPDGNLYVAGTDLNSGSGAILRYLADGTPDGVLISSGLTAPTYLAFVPEPASLLLFSPLPLLLKRRRRRA